MEHEGQRPNVRLEGADLYLNVHIAGDRVTLSLDSSGESLHKRGYRVANTQAPINEALAAGMLLLAGWNGQSDFYDPMCGSGTILIEAALIALNIYPGVFRKEFAFERWKDFDEDLFDKIYNDDSQEREFYNKIYGYDINRKAVASALENVRSAGVAQIVEVEQKDFYEFEQPVEKAIMVTNPPYGERVYDIKQAEQCYKELGEALKKMQGWSLFAITSAKSFERYLGKRADRERKLYNSNKECRYYYYYGKKEKPNDRR
jgi:putative N6-adenine-specific DNA methylase